MKGEPNPDVASLQARLEEGLSRLKIPATDVQAGRLVDFLMLLVKWNKVYNLTSVRDPADMLVVHVLDSLSVLPLIDLHAQDTLLDVGSGAGLPAIPLAIMRPLSVWSVDAVAKKIGFQLQVKASLALEHLRPIHGRIEAVTIGQPVSVIVARAFSQIEKLLVSIEHLVDRGTTVIAMKGVEPVDELKALPPAWRVHGIVPLDVPFLGAQRCAVVLKRAS